MSFDEMAGSFDEFMSFPTEIGEQLRAEVGQRVNASPTARFLETGVGTGRMAEPFVRSGCRYTGVDLSAAMLARFSEKLRQWNLKADLALANMTQLPFSDESFDVVMASNVYRIVRPWQGAAAEALRVLRRPGHFVLFMHHGAPGSMELVLTEKKRELLEGFGVGAYPREGAKEDKVVEFFLQAGASGEIFVTDAWRKSLTPRRYIARALKGRRTVGQPWALELAAALETLARQKYGSLDAAEEVIRTMRVDVLRLS